MKRSPRFDRRFRFAKDELNDELISRVSRAAIPYAVDRNRHVYYNSEDEESFEDVLAGIRSSVFPRWQVLSSPKNWADRYRLEMERRGIAYQEEWTNGSIEFLISQEHDPHGWELA